MAVQSDRTGIRRFGPTALATPANVVTIARVLLAIPLFALIYDRGAGWLTWGGWAVLASSDGLDGWIARRDGTTRSGAYLDPLADKVLTMGGFTVLVTIDLVWWLPVAIMATREVGISAYRSFAGRRGVSLPALWSGKAKTFCQLVAVGIPIWPLTDGYLGLHDALVWLSVALSVGSGIHIVRRGWVETASQANGLSEVP